MKYFAGFVTLVCGSLLTLTTCAQQQLVAKDYLAVPGPLVFNNTTYHLSWSALPATNFYKQEYLPKGAVLEKYKRMVLIDVIKGEQDIKKVVGAKVAELKKQQVGNPMVNYELMQHPSNGEYLLDFLLTANTPGGDIAIIEHNVYRYKVARDKKGQSGILLFGISTREYDTGVTAFLTQLKVNRKSLVNKVAQFTLPVVELP